MRLVKTKQIEWNGNRGMLLNYKSFTFQNSPEDDGGIVNILLNDRYVGLVEYNSGDDFKKVAQDWIDNHVSGLIEAVEA